MSARCGLVAIVGRANVGKSTLLNQILRQKISITSRKPQTTRYQILGLHTEGDTQLVFVDTPGWQRQPKNQLNRQMNRQVRQALAEVDCVLMLIDARGLHEDDALVAELAAEAGVPALLALNKLDRVRDKASMLPLIQSLAEQYPFFEEFLPICARTGDGVAALVEALLSRCPEREHLFPADQVTDRTVRFLAGEIIREKTMRYLGDELPYRTSVVIDEFAEEGGLTRVLATVWVDRDSQKSIVIGKDGALLKRISTDARREIEQLIEGKCYLRIWVRTKRGWADSPEALQAIGLGD